MTATATATVAISKKQLAGALFLKMTEQNTQRKFIIEAMVNECNLTFSGASTYYQNFKSGQWDAHPKAQVGNVPNKPDPKIGVDLESLTEDDITTFFNEHNHAGVQVYGFLDRTDAVNMVNAYC